VTNEQFHCPKLSNSDPVNLRRELDNPVEAFITLRSHYIIYAWHVEMFNFFPCFFVAVNNYPSKLTQQDLRCSNFKLLLFYSVLLLNFSRDPKNLYTRYNRKLSYFSHFLNSKPKNRPQFLNNLWSGLGTKHLT
jgi:hypothetical protein